VVVLTLEGPRQTRRVGSSREEIVVISGGTREVGYGEDRGGLLVASQKSRVARYGAIAYSVGGTKSAAVFPD